MTKDGRECIEDKLERVDLETQGLKRVLTLNTTTDVNGVWGFLCKACYNHIPKQSDSPIFPICDECLGNLGQLTNTKRNLKFVE